MKLLGVAAALLVPLTAFAQTFDQQKKWYKVGPNPTSIAAGDLNGDGLPEIVTSDRGRLSDPREERPAEANLSVLRAKESLVYEFLPQLRTGFGPYEVVIANIDALKAKDIVVVNFMATRNRDLTLLRNIGQDLFEPTHFALDDETLEYYRPRDGDGVPIFTVPGFTSLTVRDIDGDGYRDAIATGWSSDIIAYFPGHPERYFGDPVVFPCPGGPRDLDIADLDGDGTLDLAVACYASDEIALFSGDGKGNFVETTRFASRGKLPLKIGVRDLNGDRKGDIVVAHAHADDSVVIFYGDEEHAFSLSQEVLLDPDRRSIGYGIRDLLIGDFNGDGKSDLALACSQARQVVVLLNESEGTAPPVRFSRESYRFEGARPRALCIEDFNGDDLPDLAVALWDANAVALLLGKN